MSATAYARSGPIVQAMAVEPVTRNMGPSLAEVFGKPAAYPGDVLQSELRRMIANLADQLSELAAANVEMRQRLTALEQWNKVLFSTADMDLLGMFLLDNNPLALKLDNVEWTASSDGSHLKLDTE